MRKFRKILPLISLAICGGLLLSFVGYAGTVGVPEPERLDEVNQLAFQSVQLNAQSLFTRQAGDGETETFDETLRQDSKLDSLVVARELSRSISSATLRISGQPSPIHLPGGWRCILHSRLTI